MGIHEVVFLPPVSTDISIRDEFIQDGFVDDYYIFGG